MSKTTPLSFVVVYFAFFGTKENRLRKNVAPSLDFDNELSWMRETFLMLSVAAFFMVTLAVTLALTLKVTFFEAALTLAFFGPPSVSPSLDPP